MRDNILLKTMKKEHLESTIKQGRFCFSPPSLFNSTKADLFPAQQDRYDGYLTEDVRGIRIGQIISEDADQIRYKPPKVFPNGTLHQTSEDAKNTPFCAFRQVDEKEIYCEDDKVCIKLSESTVDSIARGFGHDAFVLVYSVQEFVDRLFAHGLYMGRAVHYGQPDQDYRDSFTDLPEYVSFLFQKDESYAWQREYRMILWPQEGTEKQLVEIGSIEDIAVGGDLEYLRIGFHLYNSDVTDPVILPDLR